MCLQSVHISQNAYRISCAFVYVMLPLFFHRGLHGRLIRLVIHNYI